MTYKKINELLLVGIIGTLISGSLFAAQYGKAIRGNRDIWWTPMSSALPLQETTGTFEMYLSRELLQSHMERGSLSAVDKSGRPYRVAAGDIKVRLNNWNKIQASLLHGAVFSAFALGGSLAFLILGIAKQIEERKKDSEKGASVDT